MTCAGSNRGIIRSMLGIVGLLLNWLASLVKSRRRLQAENLVLHIASPLPPSPAPSSQRAAI